MNSLKIAKTRTLYLFYLQRYLIFCFAQTLAPPVIELSLQADRAPIYRLFHIPALSPPICVTELLSS